MIRRRNDRNLKKRDELELVFLSKAQPRGMDGFATALRDLSARWNVHIHGAGAVETMLKRLPSTGLRSRHGGSKLLAGRDSELRGLQDSGCRPFCYGPCGSTVSRSFITAWVLFSSNHAMSHALLFCIGFQELSFPTLAFCFAAQAIATVVAMLVDTQSRFAEHSTVALFPVLCLCCEGWRLFL